MGRDVPLSHRAQQQPLPQLSLPHPQPQPQLLPPKAFPLPQQQQISTTMMMMSHRQEQLLFPLLKHISVTSL